MKRRNCVRVTRAPAASIVACVAVLCLPAVSIAADASDSSAAAAPLARGAGYGQPQGEPRVRALQRRLRTLGQRPGPIDGVYGPRTEAAVERLQRDSGLTVDGIVGPQTRRILQAETRPLVSGAGFAVPGGSPLVRTVQRRLRALGERPGPVDGLYGPRTRAAIKRFQRAAGQPATGALAPSTAIALARATTRAAASRSEERPVRAAREVRGSNPSSKRAPSVADDRIEGTAGDSRSPVLLALLALALVVGAGLLAGWLRRRPRRREASGVSPAPSNPDPSRRPNGAPALGYVCVREPETVDGPAVRDQMAAIETACNERGLMLKEVIRDTEQVNGNGSERPGRQHALQQLATGDATCLVVAELGRLSRSDPEVAYILEWFRRRESRLVAVGEGLDTGARRSGEAAEELDSIADRPAPPPETRPPERANDSTRLAGYEGRELKERIRAMRASGMTLQAIAEALNAENVPTLRGGAKWRPSAVQAATADGRQGRKASKRSNGGPRNGNGSAAGDRGGSRRPAAGRTGGEQ
jgi:peptidoglycan hydrolase-like protein with peptidoglycan-binding domain